jgi:acyl-coenzyme A thioesterase PaaI-like protein
LKKRARKINLESRIALPFKFSKFLSGDQKKRLKLESYFLEKEKSLLIKFYPKKMVMGPPGHCHGGLIASVLDECMGACCWWNGYMCLASMISVKFRYPVPIGGEYFALADLKRIERRRIYTHAEIFDLENNIYSQADGIFIKVKKKYMKDFPGYDKFMKYHKLFEEGVPVNEILNRLKE